MSLPKTVMVLYRAVSGQLEVTTELDLLIEKNSEEGTYGYRFHFPNEEVLSSSIELDFKKKEITFEDGDVCSIVDIYK